MANATKTATKVDGTTKSTATYSVDTSGFGYTKIESDIKDDFKFLVSSLPDKLNDVVQELDCAAAINDAFYVEGSSIETDISKARDEIKNDIEKLKSSLCELYSAFMTDIDNVNAELEYNFGWIIVGKVKGSVRTEATPEKSTTK